MAEHGRSRETKASPEVVWGIWSDEATWRTWNPDVVSIMLDGPFQSGTTGKMTTKAGGTHSIRLDNVKVGRAFDLVTSPAPLSTFHFKCRVEPTRTGSRIAQAVAMSGPLGGVFSALMGERIAAGFEGILAGLAGAAETLPRGA